ncbi:MAG TPA: dethiobiotin synthase [Bacteroidia bacterium]|jgi:dethiobiotin synthetase
MRKIFVTGIGTDVGKTVVSAILVEALQADYWKPVQTGTYYGTDSDKIKKYITNTASKIHPEVYCLKHYMSPHAAAEMEGVSIELDKIVPPQTNNTLIIEGAGGLMVPLNHKKELIIDLIQRLDAETVVVIQNYMGSINHSLLTLEVLKQRNMKIGGVIFNGPPHQLSHDIIMEYCGQKLLGKVGKENVMDKSVITKYAADFRNI